ncbi:hypothetical protein [Oceanibium sediminis]|uniref:hypothetical protein n=1 Tax=Oceanibium sediminis TaxID=2026339 RepID=UPI000DD3DF24|nr:hypothetical protein [Oceanibium sediminis]
MRGRARLSLILLGLLSSAPPLSATTIGGGVTGGGGGGEFRLLDARDGLVVGRNAQQSPDLHAFDEDQNILIEQDIAVDIGAYGLTIPAGSVVASHYVFFDPAGPMRQAGYVEFDAPILGIATSQRTMAATDFLANTDVTYLNPRLRGLESRDMVWIDTENPFRVRVLWSASSPGDYIRVFTSKSPGV